MKSRDRCVRREKGLLLDSSVIPCCSSPADAHHSDTLALAPNLNYEITTPESLCRLMRNLDGYQRWKSPNQHPGYHTRNTIPFGAR